MAQNKTSLVQASVFVVTTLLLSQHAVAANIYRYLDENGRTVFNSFIPPEYVKNGYTILNDRGQVIQEVPRAATPEELATIQANKAATDKAVADRIASEEADKLLIRLFRAPEEIERKRNNSLDQQKTQQDLVKLNMSKVDDEIVRLQTIIDNNVKAGRDIPADATRKITAANVEKAGYQEQLVKMDADRAKLITDADRDAKRLRELLGLPPGELAPPPALAEEVIAEAAESAVDQPAAQSAEKPAAQ